MESEFNLNRLVILPFWYLPATSVIRKCGLYVNTPHSNERCTQLGIYDQYDLKEYVQTIFPCKHTGLHYPSDLIGIKIQVSNYYHERLEEIPFLIRVGQ